MNVVTYTTKLVFASEKDRKSVLEVLKFQQSAFNACSIKRFELNKNSIKLLHGVFYNEFRKNNPEIPSALVVASERECLASYKSVKSNKHKVKSPIEKKNLSLQLNRTMYSFKSDVFSIISSGKRVKCKLLMFDKLKEFYGKCHLCDPKLFVRNGEVWIALPFETPKVEQTTNKNALGVDLGLRNFAITSDGFAFDDKNFKRKKRNLRFLKRKLQAKNTRGSKRHLRKLKRKERNRNKNYTHQMVNAILKSTDARYIAVENLTKIKVKKHKFQKKNAISQVPFFDFKRIIGYKAPRYGKTVISVDPSYTSQIDCRIGLKDGERCGRRYYGSDGVVLDADWNAAINIAKRAKHPVSFNTPYDSGVKPFGQAPVNVPIVTRLQPKLQATCFSR